MSLGGINLAALRILNIKLLLPAPLACVMLVKLLLGNLAKTPCLSVGSNGRLLSLLDRLLELVCALLKAFVLPSSSGETAGQPVDFSLDSSGGGFVLLADATELVALIVKLCLCRGN